MAIAGQEKANKQTKINKLPSEHYAYRVEGQRQPVEEI